MGKKRAQNEGSVYQRRDGRWEAKLSDGRRRHSYYATTQREALEKLNAAKRSMADGLPAAPERQTVAQFLERWLEDTVKISTRRRTYDSYATVVRNHIIPQIGHIRLFRLSPIHVQALVSSRLSEGFSPRTADYVKSVLGRAINRAVKWGLLSRNVAALVPSPKAKRPQFRFLSVDEAKQFLGATQGHRLEALFSVVLAIGLRRGEALGLRWNDLDLETGILTVNHQLQRVGGGLELSEPKTPQARRTISLPSLAVEALRSHRVRQLEQRFLAQDRWVETGHVFSTALGTPLDPRQANRELDRMLDRAGLPRMRFHDLRHTCASLLLAQNVHPRAVMEILGHSRIALTMDTYSHVMPAIKREAADQMQRILTGQD